MTQTNQTIVHALLWRVSIIVYYHTVIICEELNAPDNGNVSQPAERTVDSIATYACSERYELLGVANVTCQPNGTWSAGEPNCIGMGYHFYVFSTCK